MLKSIEISTQAQSIYLEKDNRTKVNYYLYPEFEIHRNILPAKVIQDWHQHSFIEEVIVPTKGEFEIDILEENQIFSSTVQVGDVLRVKHSIHRIANRGIKEAHFIVFRFLPSGKDHSKVIKSDKMNCESLVARLLKGQN